MKKFILSTLLVAISAIASAQTDTGAKGSLHIPRATDNNTTVKPSTTTISPTNSLLNARPDEKAEHYTKFTIGEKKPDFSMYQDNEFVNRTKEFSDRTTVKPKGDATPEFKGNQDFGEVRTKSGYVDIMAADFGAEDGDRVRVLINGQVAVPEFTLSNTYKPLRIPLQDGFNNIEFEAMNQGTQGPNTALFMVYDKDGALLMKGEWGLCTGFKGRVMVIKE
ncbi:hypothetical protein ACLI1A_17205 [Flavobacterium sp. RHBU_3]|uniref:hypothetical protein n=1 Tax=Flavobacterium sp. RHBU_3 TaxID=3391184 RepID=UPI0039849DFB